VTVEVQASSIAYTGNGAQVDFPTTFSFGEASDLTVEVDGVLKTLNTHYTVAGAGAAEPGGTVTFLVAPTNGAAVTIERNTPITQLTNFLTSGPFTAASVTRAFDKLTRIAQEQDRRLDALEALSDLVTVSDLADAVTIGDEIVTLDPVESTFPYVLPCPNGSAATFILWHVRHIDGEDSPMREPPNVDWSAGPGNQITIHNISGLMPGQDYLTYGLIFFT
jgi:hypothetical protein